MGTEKPFCFNCEKPLKDELKVGVKWCTIECKKEFYKKNYGLQSGLVREAEEEMLAEKLAYKNSPEYQQFQKRMKEVGFYRAFHELGRVIK